jgi:hypothetical protein
MDKVAFPDKEKVIDYFNANGANLTDSNLETMNFLKYELEMRKSLDEKVKSLKKNKEDNNSKLKEKENFIRELPIYLNNLEVSTLKAQSYLNLGITEKNKNLILAEKLPQALYVLYNSLTCIDKSFISYDVKILGKEDHINDFYLKYPMENINFDSNHDSSLNPIYDNNDNKEEGEHSDAGEIIEIDDYESVDKNLVETKLTKKKRKNRKIVKRWNEVFLNTDSTSDSLNLINFSKIKKFPLFIQFELKKITKSNLNESELISNANTNFPLLINFFYLPLLNIITVDIKFSNKTISLDTNHLLSNIFSPPVNFLTTFRSEINKVIHFLCDECSPGEKFIDYLQILSNNVNYNIAYLKKICGLLKQKNITNKNMHNVDSSLFNKNESTIFYDSPSKINIDNFISLLTERVIYLPSLFNQIDYLVKNKRIINDAYHEIKNEKRYQLVKEKTEIVNIYKITQNDFLKIFQENFDNEFLEENFKLISVFEKDDNGNYFKKFIKAPISIYSEDEAFYYCILFERKSIKVAAYVEIGFDYPNK